MIWAETFGHNRTLDEICLVFSPVFYSIIYQGEPIHKFCKFVSKIFFEGEMVSLSCARIWLLKTIWNIFVVRTEDKLRSNFCYIFIISSWNICAEHFNDEYECYQRIVRVSLLYDEWSFYKEKVFFSHLFISDSSVQPFRKWTLKQSIQNTWVKSEESLFYIRPGTDNFTLRLLNDSPTRWLTSDQCSDHCLPWWGLMGVSWSDTNAVMMTSLGDQLSVILLTHHWVEYKVKCPHIVKLETQRIGRKWHNELKYLVSEWMCLHEYLNIGRSSA